MGLCHAIGGMNQQAAQPMLHLQTANPYLESALHQHTSAAVAASWHLPRQSAGIACTATSSNPGALYGLSTGVSSFAFQGTNAHVLPARPAPATAKLNEPTPKAAQLAWQRSRIWPLPPAHLMVVGADTAITSGRVTLQCQLNSTSLAFLRDHQVLQRLLIPTAALLEIAAAAATTLLANLVPGVGGSNVQLCVHNSVMAAPAPLKQGAVPVLQCVVSPAIGIYEVRSVASISRSRTHLAGSFRTASPIALQRQTQHVSAAASSSSGVGALLAVHYGALTSPGTGVEATTCVAAAAINPSTNSQGLVQGSSEGFVMHPALLEAALQAAGTGAKASTAAGGMGVLAPAAVGAFMVHQVETGAHAPDVQITSSSVAGYSRMQLFGGISDLPVALAGVDFRHMSRDTAGLAVHKEAAETAAAVAGHMAPDLSAEQISLLVQNTVEAILGEPVASDVPLMAAGLDSLGATEVRNALISSLGLELPATLAIDYPNIGAISTYIIQRLQPDAGAAAARSIARPMGMRMAGTVQQALLVMGASTPRYRLTDYAAGGDGIITIPSWRWDMDRQLSGAASGLADVEPQFGCFMPDVDIFDCNIFGINPYEAATMDPQQRLLLHAAAEAMPLARSSSSADQAAVFVGIGSNDYEVLANHAGVSVSAFSFTAASAAVASGRLAYVFDTHGPSASIDTACSASLVAVHMAASNIAAGTVSSALVAGVLLCLVPQSTLMVQRAGMIAPDGRCKVLDASADGYVRGEACRALWLDTADSVAKAAGAADALAVILGTAVNTNGRASSLTAPHGPTQQDLIANALFAAGLPGSEVSGVVMHANGTSLGDPIEVGTTAVCASAGRRCSMNAKACWHTGTITSCTCPSLTACEI